MTRWTRRRRATRRQRRMCVSPMHRAQSYGTNHRLQPEKRHHDHSPSTSPKKPTHQRPSSMWTSSKPLTYRPFKKAHWWFHPAISPPLRYTPCQSLGQSPPTHRPQSTQYSKGGTASNLPPTVEENVFTNAATSATDMVVCLSSPTSARTIILDLRLECVDATRVLLQVGWAHVAGRPASLHWRVEPYTRVYAVK
jgi:hypothetical protein